MVFNTGAALLDAIVLAVVSREEEGTLQAGTEGIIKSQKKVWYS